MDMLARVIALTIADGDRDAAEEIIKWAYGEKPETGRKEKKQRNGTPLFIRKYLKPSTGDDKERIEQFINRCIIKRQKNVDFEIVANKILNMPYRDFLETPYWKGTALFVKRREGWKCSVCGSTGNLDVHHKTYDHHGNEIYHLDELTTLCKECHRKVHETGK